ncbi:hypothetical protein CT0861_00756 [Colletotrichum tofieldiae]|uniref:Uncharacterized protein n=1 Tax=Colletotrichum tofieldiae TaxID=708197 RepID=A0A161W5Z0_9PEZI|nr:hypothetical protein CT0861_00756 [Colletotrichum tofieldiae]GKT94956.1 hypothetical protein Ct61P_12806 [Colletotrichum tofieldiae]
MKPRSLWLGLLSLAGLSLATCPTEIHATVPHHHFYVGHHNPRRAKTLSEIHSTLETCPNITTLDLRFAYIGCEESPERWSLPFSPSGSTRFPSAIESLSLAGYSFGESEAAYIKGPPRRWIDWETTSSSIQWWVKSGNAWRWLRWQFLPEAQKSKTNIELWLGAMDFSQVRNLSITESGFELRKRPPEFLANTLAPHLPSLRSLAVEGPELRDFVCAIPAESLSALSWVSPGTAHAEVQTFLERHGKQLTALEWRTPESLERVRPVIPTTILQTLKSLTPRLEHLTLDLNRNSTTWPWEELKALAQGSPDTLTNVTVYLEMASECQRQKMAIGWEAWNDMDPEACTGTQEFAQPLLNSTTALEVTSFLLHSA